MGSNSTVIVVAVIIIGHFLVGIGYLLYKLNTPDSQKKKKG